MPQPFLFPAQLQHLRICALSERRSESCGFLLLLQTSFSTRLVNKLVHHAPEHQSCAALTGLHRRWALRRRRSPMRWKSRSNCRLSRTLQLYREITTRFEHVFSNREGVWRVSITGSRASETWELRIEEPNGFERSDSLFQFILANMNLS
jgi:hypothetical protein